MSEDSPEVQVLLRAFHNASDGTARYEALERLRAQRLNEAIDAMQGRTPTVICELPL